MPLSPPSRKAQPKFAEGFATHCWTPEVTVNVRLLLITFRGNALWSGTVTVSTPICIPSPPVVVPGKLDQTSPQFQAWLMR